MKVNATSHRRAINLSPRDKTIFTSEVSSEKGKERRGKPILKQIKFPDHRTKSWFLSNSPGPLLIILVTYLYFCLYAGPRYMKNRKPFQLKQTLIVYNVIQVVLSAVLVIEVSYFSYCTSTRAINTSQLGQWRTKIQNFICFQQRLRHSGHFSPHNDRKLILACFYFILDGNARV